MNALFAGKGKTARDVENESNCGKWNIFRFCFFLFKNGARYRETEFAREKTKIFSSRARSYLTCARRYICVMYVHMYVDVYFIVVVVRLCLVTF